MNTPSRPPARQARTVDPGAADHLGRAAGDMTLLPADARVRKPWKNGGGVTTDVLVVPEGAGLDDFVVRISIADVAHSGPFSVFPGIDRSTAILAGGGFALTVGDERHRLGPEDAPLAYPGDVPTEAQLLDGATSDLNVMTRRGVVAHRLERRTLTAGETLTLPGKIVLVWAGGVGHVASGDLVVTLAVQDAVVIAAPTAITAESAAVVFVVSFVDAAPAARQSIPA